MHSPSSAGSAPAVHTKNRKTLRILLVNPAQLSNYMAKTARTFLVPQNTLSMVAALTPDDEVTVIDELVEDVPLDTPADLVGITALTDNVIRAYQLADAFRARGVPVVMGGAHPSAVPQEALQHADAVVAGEAEGTWERVVELVRAGGRPQGVYQGSMANMEGLQWPRRDLIRKERYFPVDMVQTSRGCPHACEFCSVHTFYGRKFRHRPVREVIAEIEQTCGERLFFVDDIVNGDPRYSRELCRELAPLKRQWVGQMTIALGKDPELVAMMAKSGCAGVFIGFESVDQETLKSMRKPHNRADRYAEHLKVIRGNGIPVLGAFVFGFDNDDPDVFDRTLEFIFQARIDLAQFTVITPLPGTDLYPRWEREGRLRYRDWWLTHHWSEVLFHPAKMSPEQLRSGWVRSAVEYYRADRIARRMLGHLPNGVGQSLFVGQMNWSYRQSAWTIARDLGMVN